MVFSMPGVFPNLSLFLCYRTQLLMGALSGVSEAAKSAIKYGLR